jgi:hypothetical protein
LFGKWSGWLGPGAGGEVNHVNLKPRCPPCCCLLAITADGYQGYCCWIVVTVGRQEGQPRVPYASFSYVSLIAPSHQEVHFGQLPVLARAILVVLAPASVSQRPPKTPVWARLAFSLAFVMLCFVILNTLTSSIVAIWQYVGYLGGCVSLRGSTTVKIQQQQSQRRHLPPACRRHLP